MVSISTFSAHITATFCLALFTTIVVNSSNDSKFDQEQGTCTEDLLDNMSQTSVTRTALMKMRRNYQSTSWMWWTYLTTRKQSNFAGGKRLTKMATTFISHDLSRQIFLALSEADSVRLSSVNTPFLMMRAPILCSNWRTLQQSTVWSWEEFIQNPGTTSGSYRTSYLCLGWPPVLGCRAYKGRNYLAQSEGPGFSREYFPYYKCGKKGKWQGLQ